MKVNQVHYAHIYDIQLYRLQHLYQIFIKTKTQFSLFYQHLQAYHHLHEK